MDWRPETLTAHSAGSLSSFFFHQKKSKVLCERYRMGVFSIPTHSLLWEGLYKNPTFHFYCHTSKFLYLLKNHIKRLVAIHLKIFQSPKENILAEPKHNQKIYLRLYCIASSGGSLWGMWLWMSGLTIRDKCTMTMDSNELKQLIRIVCSTNQIWSLAPRSLHGKNYYILHFLS